MDEIPNPNQTTAIARAYLKRLNQERTSTSTKVQQSGVQAWLELEERLMLGSEPKPAEEIQLPTAPRTAIAKKDKKAQSIWKRPISEFWR